MKLNVGITGQQGFIGHHLYSALGLYPEEFQRVEFQREFFEEPTAMAEFVSRCDVIVHLAAINRHSDSQVIYRTNLNLVDKLISGLNKTGAKPHLIFSSSSQEERDNDYGKSKKEGRHKLEEWAGRAGATCRGLIIPNVFGPFGAPFYNSFIATFCHQLTHNETPVIDVDSDVQLIYVGDLVKLIIDEIRSREGIGPLVVPHTDRYKVSEILSILNRYKQEYFDSDILPKLDNRFEINLFNTFRSYIDLGTRYPRKYTKHSDTRGTFVEIIRLNDGGQVSFSTTVPGVTRGNHFHTRKIERFSVIKGRARIELRRIGSSEVINFYLDGDEPSFVDMPVWYTHNITNVGEEELYTIFWINEFYDPDSPDTYFEVV